MLRSLSEYSLIFIYHGDYSKESAFRRFPSIFVGFAVAIDDDEALLARIDERTEGLSTRMGEVEERLEKTATKDDLKTLVTLDRHRPVEMIAYGLAAAVLSTVLNVVLKGTFHGLLP